MNAIFLTQSSGLGMFYELMKALREPLQLDRIGFLLAYYPYFCRFRQGVSDIESGGYHLLKEWEITDGVRNGKPDLDLINDYERKLGNPHLWGPLVADRRVYLGGKSAFFQDYRPRFNHTQMLNVLQAGLVSVERLFDEVQPNFVACFQCVTFGEYLAYLFARSRGIPFLNLRPTRIKNYQIFGESIFEPSERVQTAYERYLAAGAEDAWTEEAREYVSFVQGEHALYEGVGVSTLAPKPRSIFSHIGRLPTTFMNLVRGEYNYRFGEVRDNHDPGVLVPFLYQRFLKPMELRRVNRRLSSEYVTEAELSTLDYVFCPLHTEWEVTLAVYSKPYLNQIEIIRNVSHSIPVGMTVLVKEHPVSIGKRPLSYYQKMLDMPNVRLADPAMSSKPLVANARFVATLAGSIGWEAVMRQKPVVIFGHTPYEFLPNSMVRRVTDLERLGVEIADLLKNYRYREDAVNAYAAAIMSQSAPINLYSTLLGRAGVYAPGEGVREPDEALRRDIEILARYAVETLGVDPARSPVTAG